MEHAQRGLLGPAEAGQLGAARGSDGVEQWPVMAFLHQARLPQADLGRAAGAAARGRAGWRPRSRGRGSGRRPGPGVRSRSAAITAAVAGGGLAAGARSSIPRAAVSSSIAITRVSPSTDAAQLARGGPAHRDVVLLHRRAGDRVDARRDGEPLELGDDRRLRVLGDHQAGVHARVVGEERRQAVAARRVEEAVGAALGDARDVGGGDREEVEHVARAGRRGSCRWTPCGRPSQTTGLSIAAASSRVATAAACSTRVAGRAADGGPAAQRVGVLHARVLRAAVAGDDRAARQHRADVGGGERLPVLRAQVLQVGGEHAVGAEQALDAHRRRDVGGRQQVAQVGDREHEHAEHPVGAVDQREPLLLAQLDGCRPASRRAARRRRRGGRARR